MCFQFYEGKGYNEDFTDHMGRIIREMETDPSQKIQLRVSTDIVCVNCPNNESGVCSSQDKVIRYDNEVLKACHRRKMLSLVNILTKMNIKIISFIGEEYNGFLRKMRSKNIR